MRCRFGGLAQLVHIAPTKDIGIHYHAHQVDLTVCLHNWYAVYAPKVLYVQDLVVLILPFVHLVTSVPPKSWLHQMQDVHLGFIVPMEQSQQIHFVMIQPFDLIHVLPVHFV